MPCLAAPSLCFLPASPKSRWIGNGDTPLWLRNSTMKKVPETTFRTHCLSGGVGPGSGASRQWVSRQPSVTSRQTRVVGTNTEQKPSGVNWRVLFGTGDWRLPTADYLLLLTSHLRVQPPDHGEQT